MVPGINPSYVSPGSFLLLKTFLLVLAYLIPCYVFINLVLPCFINRKWLQGIVILVPLVCVMYGSGWFMYWKLFPFIDFVLGLPAENQYPTKFWPAIVLGLIDPLKIIAAAAVITYVKQWWNRQKEKEDLQQEKLNAELQLLKAQISPRFLFNALDNIYYYAKANSSRTPDLLMKLSDLLSYMIYECDSTFVPLEKEIERMQDFIALEKLRFNGSSVEVGFNVTGEIMGHKIAPFLLVPFIEHSFRYRCNNSEHAWVNMDIGLENEMLTLKLASCISASNKDKSDIPEGTLADVQKRLSLLYPQKHELKISWESEMFIVLLKIRTTTELQNSVEQHQLILLT